jgi:glycosyltransferase involved in cell wall biosynthesis
MRRYLGVPMRSPVAELRMMRPDLFICEYDRFNLAVGAVVARALAGRVAFRVLPNYDSWSDRTWWRELSKHFLFRSIDAAKVSGPAAVSYSRKYGLPAWRTAEVTQSVDIKHYGQAAGLRLTQGAELRRRFGAHGCVFLYVGRLWRGKGVDHLIAAFELLRAAHADATLLVAGDGVDEEDLRQLAARSEDIVFVGFVQPADLPPLYAAADVFVFPTLGDPNGLVVEEAMVAGLPVISTTAAGEIERRLPHGEAGLLVEPGDPDALAARMLELCDAPSRRARMGANGRSLAMARSDERYAVDFHAMVEQVWTAPVRTGAAAQLSAFLGWAIAGVWGRRRPSELCTDAHKNP